MNTSLTMDKFFSLAGELISSRTVEEGTFPTRKFIAVFLHEKGSAEFDGRDWKFFLNPTN